jgi:hypothetical protein
MKVLFSFLLAALATTTYGQDFCKQVKKEVSDDKMTYDYSSPFDQYERNGIKVTRSFNTDIENGYDNFIITFQYFAGLDDIYTKNDKGEQVEKKEKSLIIEFEDKTTIKDDTIAVLYDFSDDKAESKRFVYFPVTEENVSILTSKKIVKYTIAGFTQAAPADPQNAIAQYIKCMMATKKFN